MAPRKDAASTAPLTPPLTALQGHIAFFDRDSDGVIWPSDTYVGFRVIGFGCIISILGSVFIHVGFSYLTSHSWIPDPFFRLNIDRMHRAIHGSDSRSYSHRGELDEARLDEIFGTYTDAPHDKITLRQTLRLLKGDFGPFDPFGWAASLEWVALIILLGSPLHKEDVKAVLDGSLWNKLAVKNAQKKNMRGGLKHLKHSDHSYKGGYGKVVVMD